MVQNYPSFRAERRTRREALRQTALIAMCHHAKRPELRRREILLAQDDGAVPRAIVL
jgi:hypothetical protein